METEILEKLEHIEEGLLMVMLGILVLMAGELIKYLTKK